MALKIRLLALSMLVFAVTAAPASAVTPKVGTKWKGTLANNPQYPKQKAKVSFKIVKSGKRKYVKGSAKVTTTCQTEAGQTPEGDTIYQFTPGPTYTYRFKVRLRKGGSFDTGDKYAKDGKTFEALNGTFSSKSKGFLNLRYARGVGLNCGLPGGGVSGTVKRKKG